LEEETKMKLANAFSISMLPLEGVVVFDKLKQEEAISYLHRDMESYIGHQDTANLLSNILGLEVPVNRASLTIFPGEDIVIAQYIGPRLPEGTTVLPDDAKIQW
jgi:hypothetical protein